MRALAADGEQWAFVAGDFNTTPAMGALRELPDRLVDDGATDSVYRRRGNGGSWWRIDCVHHARGGRTATRWCPGNRVRPQWPGGGHVFASQGGLPDTTLQ